MVLYRMHPVIERFVMSDLPVQDIINMLEPIPSPPLVALTMLSDCLDGRRLARDAIRAAKETPLKDQDPEITILLLARWAELSARLSNLSEAQTLLHQARALMSDGTHPEIIAAVDFSTSVLESSRGNQQERELLLKRIFSHLPETSPRRKFYLREWGLLLARQGRGIEFGKEGHQLAWETGTHFPLEMLDCLYFIDDIETGRVRSALQRAKDVKFPMPMTTPQERRMLREYAKLLECMQNVVVSPSSPSPSRPETNASGPTLPVWGQILDALHKRQASRALKMARMEAKRLLATLFDTGLSSYNLIRAELASGNAEAARRLLHMRHARGNHHYMDHFFMARAHMLDQRLPDAIAVLQQTLQAVETYDARGRLDFEVALSIERSPAEMLQLLKQASSQPVKPIKPPPLDNSASLTATKPSPTRVPEIIGRSNAVNELHETIRQMAVLETPVLITGETGTGKELVARALHRHGPRADHPFVAINCGAISEPLLESELFGHERGSFTGADRTTRGLFEDAGDGTLLLDEIGDISPRLQTVLLRVLETGEVRAIGSSRSRKIRCRLLAATNASLEQRVADGLFRQDLLYRLQRLTIHIAPLRERRDDIMAIARHFLDEGRPDGIRASVTRAFVNALQHYDWPGNVRELRNIIERMRLTHSDKLDYDVGDLDIRRAARPSHSIPAGVPSQRIPADSSRPIAWQRDQPVEAYLRHGRSTLRRLERLRDLFHEHQRLTRAEIADLLDISPNTATKYLKELQNEAFIRIVQPGKSSRSRYFEKRSPQQDNR